MAWAAGLFRNGGLDAAVGHVRAAQEARAAATEALVAAEHAFLTDLAEQHREGAVSWAQLDAAYQLVAFNGDAAPGATTRWAELVGTPRAGMQRRVREEAATRNGGEWSGHWPRQRGESCPPNEQPVAYLLYDSANVPVYVGSTVNLAPRLGQHTTDKVFTQWVAYRCATRDEAYDLEDRFLRQFKPRYNIRGARRAAS